MNSQATLVNNWRAKFWIWLLGNGTKELLLRKSNTLWPKRSVTIQMWFRKSKQSRKWMHLFRFVLSLDANVDSTRNSIFDASRYFCTERIIFTAHRTFRCLSYASTTLPKVPWPSKRIIESISCQQVLSPLSKDNLTSIRKWRICLDYIMSIIIINFFVFPIRVLRGSASLNVIWKGRVNLHHE